MPMPIDLAITFKDGSTTNYNIPLQIMRNEKKADRNMKFEVVKDWQWTNPDYKLTIPQSKDEIDQIQIDPTERLADINANNNRLKVQ